MRVHPAVLLVLIALVVPLVVELRTVAVWVGVELSLAQTAVIGVFVVGALVAWAVFPDVRGSRTVRNGE